MLNVVVLTTGPLFSLPEAKQHLMVEHDNDDLIIEIYSDAAVLSCLKATDRVLVPQGAEPVYRVAALMMLGDFYTNRVPVIQGQSFGVSPTIDRLLASYRVYRA